MKTSSKDNEYTFAKYFNKVFVERFGFNLDEDIIAYIKCICKNQEPHVKIDDKGRYSEYFTFRLNEKLITIVCDHITKKIVTCFEETHRRKKFDN